MTTITLDLILVFGTIMIPGGGEMSVLHKMRLMTTSFQGYNLILKNVAKQWDEAGYVESYSYENPAEDTAEDEAAQQLQLTDEAHEHGA
jgi:hypothetical protein